MREQAKLSVRERSTPFNKLSGPRKPPPSKFCPPRDVLGEGPDSSFRGRNTFFMSPLDKARERDRMLSNHSNAWKCSCGNVLFLHMPIKLL